MLLALIAALGVGVDSAAAASPFKRALYADAGDGVGEYGVLYLRVSSSGRWLNPRRSTVYWEWGDVRSNCRVRLRLGSWRRPVRVRHGGGFRFVRRRGAFVSRVRGRFVTKDRARVAFRYRREPARGGRPRTCDDISVRLVARRIVPLNFRNCSSHKARTLLLAPTGRIFRQPRWWAGGRYELAGWKETAYACLYTVNTPVSLGVDDDSHSDVEDDLTLFRLVGPYVAFLRQENCGNFACYTVFVRDLRSGTTTKRVPAGRAPDLELNSRGSVAWIDQGSPLDATDTSLWASDNLGKRQLDNGNISDQLTLTDSTLTWRKDGLEHSTVLY